MMDSTRPFCDEMPVNSSLQCPSEVETNSSITDQLSLSASTLVVIDPSVDNHSYLANGVIAGIDVRILDAGRDGVEQITQLLQFAAVQPQVLHIVSHGGPGTLYLGNSELSLSNLKHYAQNLQSWNISDLLLYGCNVAAGDAGEEFIARLKQLTTANIAASKTKTGHAGLGGNWDLEVYTGDGPVFIPIAEQARLTWNGVLDNDGDGVDDALDIDDDNDGIPDNLEIGAPPPDTDNDGVPNVNESLDVLFVMDTSGSIDANEWTLFSQIANETSTLLQSNSGDARFGVIHLDNGFGRGYEIQSDFSTSAVTVTDKLGLSNIFEAAITDLSTELDDGDTELEVRDGAKPIIVYFTDALAPELDPKVNSANAFKAVLPNAEIVTIQVGTTNPTDFAVAAAIATQGGTYTGLVDSYLSDPEAPGIGPRRFTGGNFSDVDLISQLAAQNILYIETPDTDGDGIIDRFDLDSDNDGIPDNVEAQSTNGYVAPGTFTDTDGDGLNDVYDGDNGGTDLIPVNTDASFTNGDALADYIDTDSDNDGSSDTVEAGRVLNALNVGTNGLDNDVETADDYSDPNGILNDPTTLPDIDNDLASGGDVDFRDNVNDNDSGQLIPDFNKDNKPDLFWRNLDNDNISIWYMNDVKAVGGGFVGIQPGQAWQAIAVGDFDTDGQDDLVWFNKLSGAISIWEMNDLVPSGGGILPVRLQPNGNWDLKAVGDFDKDGSKDDLLWRDPNSGANRIWYMDGVTPTTSAPLLSVPAGGWDIAGVGDFEGTGIADDIIWRNYSNGKNLIWLMDGSTSKSSAQLMDVLDPNWRIEGAIDINTDGNSDILWRNYTSGDTRVWYMNGTTSTSWASLVPTVANTAWEVTT